MAVGETFLALLVALVSVLAMALPIVRETFTTRNSNVKVTFAGAQDKYLFLIATNSGSSPGSIASAQISIVGVDATFSMARSRTTPPFSLVHNRIAIPTNGDQMIGSIPLMIEGWEGNSTFIQAGESKRLRSQLATDRGDRGMKVSPAITELLPPRTMRCWLEVDVIQFDGTREAQAFVPIANSPSEWELCWLAWQHRRREQ